MLLGCVGLNNLVTSLGKNILYCMCFLSFFGESLLRAARQEVVRPRVLGRNKKGAAANGTMFLATHLQVSILCAAMGEQNDLANDAREGPFRTGWISLLGMLSKRQ